MPRLDLVERVVDGAAAVPRNIPRPAPYPHKILFAAYVDGRLRRRCAHPLGALARRRVGEGGRAERGGHAWPRRPARVVVPAGWSVDAARHPVGGRPPAERRRPEPRARAAAQGRKGALPCLSTATSPLPLAGGPRPPEPRSRWPQGALRSGPGAAASLGAPSRRSRRGAGRAAGGGGTGGDPAAPPLSVMAGRPRRRRQQGSARRRRAYLGACSAPCRACRSSARTGRAALSRSAGVRQTCAALGPAPDRRHGPRISRPLRAARGAIGRAHSAAWTPRRRSLSGRRLPPSSRPASRCAIDDRPPAAAFRAASTLPLPPIDSRLLSPSMPKFRPKNPPASSFYAPAPYIHTATI